MISSLLPKLPAEDPLPVDQDVIDKIYTAIKKTQTRFQVEDSDFVGTAEVEYALRKFCIPNFDSRKWGYETFDDLIHDNSFFFEHESVPMQHSGVPGVRHTAVRRFDDDSFFRATTA